MFNSTAGLRHLRVTWHSFVSILCLHGQSLSWNGKRIGGVRPATPTIRLRANAASKGLNEYGASTFGTRCREIIDPFRPPSPSATPRVSLALNERLHSHVNSRCRLHENCRRARRERGKVGRGTWDEDGMIGPIPVNFARRGPTSGARVVLWSLSRGSRKVFEAIDNADDPALRPFIRGS